MKAPSSGKVRPIALINGSDGSDAFASCVMGNIAYLNRAHARKADPYARLQRYLDIATPSQVMGGVSESTLRVVPGAGETVEGSGGGGGIGAAAVFSGEVCTSNSGGFVSVRTRNISPPLDLSAYDALRLRVKGDGNRYKFSM